MSTDKTSLENENQPSCLGVVSGSFKLANQTGKLMFKFDDDEPQECATIYDYGKVTIEMQQQKELDNNLQQTTNSIEFTSKDGKKFRLFIENCR